MWTPERSRTREAKPSRIAESWLPEVTMTVAVGPTLADSKGRVRVTVDLSRAPVNHEAANLVSSRELSIPAAAKRAYAEADRKLRRNDIEGAVTLLRKAVDIEPRFAAAWNHLGTIAYQTARYEEAEGHFRRALEEDPAL